MKGELENDQGTNRQKQNYKNLLSIVPKFKRIVELIEIYPACIDPSLKITYLGAEGESFRVSLTRYLVEDAQLSVELYMEMLVYLKDHRVAAQKLKSSILDVDSESECGTEPYLDEFLESWLEQITSTMA